MRYSAKILTLFPFENTMAMETYLSFALHENVGEESLVTTVQHTCAEVPQGYSLLLLSNLCFWQGERITRGFTHSHVLLSLLTILHTCLGNIQNWQSLKAFSLRPRSFSPYSETISKWHLRKECNALLVKVLGGLRKTGFIFWLCNVSSSWPWATHLIYPCLGTKFPAPHKTALILHLLIFDGHFSRALLQWVHSVGSRSKLRIIFEKRAIYHTHDRQFLSPFT